VRLGVRAIIAAAFVLAAALGALAGVLFTYTDDLPEISALDDYRPNTITRIHARGGEVIGEFATERRVVVGYDDIAPVLRQAIIASEDAEFEQHVGLSISRILITAIRDVVYSQRFGASTITQQLARLLFLSSYMQGGIFERSPERKIKEIIVAIQIEKRYTKREIFTFYANQINFGHGAYGVEAASRMYFAKSAKDLTLDEAAAIAAIIQTPARLSPFVNPDRTLARRNNYVLPRMVAEGLVTQAEADTAAAKPLVLRGQPTPERSIAPYFVEEVRKTLEQEYGADALYQAGMRVQTSLDADLQRAANDAIDHGLRRVDKRRNGFRRPVRNVVREGMTPEQFSHERWSTPARAGDIVPAVVTAMPRPGSPGPIRLRVMGVEADLTPAGYSWTRRASLDTLLAVGDVIEVQIRALDGGVPRDLLLEQPPSVEGALVAIDNRTGQIRAMVGGFSFLRSKFNRATQAKRQVGSLFKPIVYTAAIDRGYTGSTMLIDEPVSYPAGPNQPPYQPLNYDRKFEGRVTLRRALEQSRNVPAVRTLADVGPGEAVAYARRFGLSGEYPPYLSLALGAAEGTLIEMTSAYAAFANQGVRLEPYGVVSIMDRQGAVLREHRPQPREAIRADTAFVMTHLLRGVVERGTAGAAAAIHWPLAGKTGTVDDYTDAWFIGYDPDLTVGVWVGYDEKKSLGTGETGGTTALPIWMDVMKAYIASRGSDLPPPEFEPPGNIVMVTLESGLTEAFINGTQPADSTPTPSPTPAAAPPGPTTVPRQLE
jgi:penicillin-binding protein 1A